MSLAAKVVDRPFICSVLLGFSGEALPLANTELFQKWYDTQLANYEIESIYTTPSKTTFSESAKPSRPGPIFTQKLSFSLPISSLKRSTAIEKILNLKYVVIQLSNRRFIHIGRNDYLLNSYPKVSYNSDENIANFQIDHRSMSASGYIQLSSLPGFPFLIPVNI